MNVGYVIAKLSPFIWKQDFSTLLKLTPQTVRKCIDLKNLFDGINSQKSVEQFVYTVDSIVVGVKTPEKIVTVVNKKDYNQDLNDIDI